MSYQYAKFKENPFVGTNISTPSPYLSDKTDLRRSDRLVESLITVQQDGMPEIGRV